MTRRPHIARPVPAAAGGVPGSVLAELDQAEQGQGFGQGDRGRSGRQNIRLSETPLGVKPLDWVVGDQPLLEFGS